MTFGRNLQEMRERRAAEKAANLRSLATVPAHRLHVGTYAKADVRFPTSQPKTEQRRNARLLKLARLMPCLLMIPGVCSGRVDTTVACHSNFSFHGKAWARKADDCYSVWGCAACHRWLDQGPAPLTQKVPAFLGAHAKQVIWWRQIAEDDTWPAADRRAAKWAIDQLKESA